MSLDRPTPLEAFERRLAVDRDAGEILDIVDYLVLYPGDSLAIAARYLELAPNGASHPSRIPPKNEARATVGLPEPTSATALHRPSYGHFEVIRVLGAGGQGVVYLAEDTRLRSRRVALKVLREGYVGRGDLERRLRREADVLAALDDPGICRILDADLDHASPWIALDFIPGRNLAEVLAGEREAKGTWPGSSCSEDVATAALPTHATRDDGQSSLEFEASLRPLPTDQALFRTAERVREVVVAFERVALSLHAAHEAGFLHRDIKPGNLMLRSDGRLVILDFGLARDDAERSNATETGLLLGTPAYMSPEQLEGGAVRLDRRTDIYSLGATLYEALSGLKPYQEAGTREQLFQWIRSKDPMSLQSLQTGVPRDVDVILRKAMSKSRDRRYSTAREFADDLRRWLDRRPIRATPTPAWVSLHLWIQRNRPVAIATAVVFLSLVTGLTIALVALESTRRANDEKQLALMGEREANRQYVQMSDASLATRLLREGSRLWPRRPEVVPAMDRWIAAVDRLLARRASHISVRDRLRKEAGPAPEVSEDDEIRRRELFPELHERLESLDASIAQAEVELEFMEELLDRTPAPTPDMTEHERTELVELARARAAHHSEIVGKRERWIAERDEHRAGAWRTERLTLGSGDASAEWRYEVLTRLLADLGRLERLREDVEARRVATNSIASRTLREASETWRTCLADIARDPRYGGNVRLEATGQAERLEAMGPQIGLIPLGRDARSGLWEFWHVESGARPPWTAVGADPLVGFIELTDESDFGLVFVLLPGGPTSMGSDPRLASPRTDADARPDESPLVDVDLAPFFHSKYEVTQAQWSTLRSKNPSLYFDGRGRALTGRNPVEQITWLEAAEAARQWGLALPTEAQWEYAARAGTWTPWWCGSTVASVFEARAGNIADTAYGEAQGSGTWESGHDGHGLHAPVGSFAPNGFGLYDTLGNVFEWCADIYGSYLLPHRPGDGLRQTTTGSSRVSRGGGFDEPALAARSASRLESEAQARYSALGFRPVRPLDP